MVRLARSLSGVHRNVIILGWVSLLTDLSGQMVFPLLPLYLTSVLGTGAVAVGLVEGAAEATASLLKVFSGYWSDRICRRKPFVLAGYGLSALMKPVLVLAGSWGAVLLVRVVDRVGKGLRGAPRDAIIAESNARETMGKAYGLQRSMDGLGSVGGAILAFVLLPLLGFKNLFLLAVVPGLVSVLVILWVHEPRPQQRPAAKVTLRVGLASLTTPLRRFILVASIFGLGNYGYAIIMLRAKSQGLSNVQTIMIYAGFYVIYAALSPLSGALSDRFGRKPLILAGYGVFSLLSLGLGLISGIAATVVFFLAFGVFFAMIDGVQRAYVADLAPAELKGTALGTFHTFTGLVALPAGFIAGVLFDSVGPGFPFLFGTATSLVAIAGLLAMDPRRPPAGERRSSPSLAPPASR